MEAAAVASSGTGLRCSINPVPNPQRISAGVRFTTKRQPCAAACRRLLLRPSASAYTAASAAIDSGDGYPGVSRKRLAVFVSGGGSNFRSIHEAALGGKVNGDVAVLVTDKPVCGGAEYARCNGIPVVVFPKSKSAPEGMSTDELLNVLRYSGPTVHFVDEQFDMGRTLAQRVVPVLANDTPELLAARVLHEEHQVYVEAVAALCEDRIVWREDGVPLIRSRTKPNAFT